MRELSSILVIILALIAAVVATGLIAGYSMQAFIVAYWLVLTMKSMNDYIENRRKK